MVRVLVFINEITQTSIPFEIASHVARQTDIDVTVASFYDDPTTESAVEIPGPLEIRLLDATSRFDLDAWHQLHSQLKKGYNILHTHHNFTGSVARVLAAAQGIAIVNTEHRNHDSFTRLQNAVNAPTLPQSDRLVSNSRATQSSLRWYETILIPDERLQVIHNGVDLDRIAAATAGSPTESNPEGTQIITVGRMVPVKDHETLLRAFRSVSERIPEAELALVGDGPLREDLETLAEQLNITDSVTFTGRLPRESVYERLAASDLFVLPSRAEGFCVATVEAMACEVPVVASDIDVLHEVLGEGGTFVPAEDTAAFADAIVDLLSNDEERRKLGQMGRQRVEEMFRIDRVAYEYYNIYETVHNG